MPERPKKILTEPIQVVQLNPNRSPDVSNTDILLRQESAFSTSTLPQHLFLTPKIPGFKTILPIDQLRTPPANRILRVMAYARERNDVIVVPRYDICLDHDMTVIEIQPRPHQPVLVVNIYNPPSGSIGTHSTEQRLKLMDLSGTFLTIVAGDFNQHHPDWEEMTTEPPATARVMAEWLQDKSFSLLNVHNYPTFHHHNHLHHSVSDLTLANTRAIGRTLASQWKVDEEAHTGSYHVVIRFTIVNERIATGETVIERPNWKKANREKYNEAFRAALDEKRQNDRHDEPGTTHKGGVRGRRRGDTRSRPRHDEFTLPNAISQSTIFAPLRPETAPRSQGSPSYEPNRPDSQESVVSLSSGCRRRPAVCTSRS